MTIAGFGIPPLLVPLSGNAATPDGTQLYIRHCVVCAAQPYMGTMLMLQHTIREHDYPVSEVQRIDIGLPESGHDTDKYRVVFFGKPDEVRVLSTKYPDLIPYLPIKVAIFGEGEETLLVTASSERFSEFYP